jgi:acyl carrier protein
MHAPCSPQAVALIGARRRRRLPRPFTAPDIFADTKGANCEAIGVMDIGEDIKSVLDETLNLNGASANWTDGTALLGSLPELSSVAIVGVLLALEEHFAIVFADDELDAELFATLGNIRRFIEGKLAQGTN